MERLSDTVIEIVNELHRERLDYKSEYVPLIDALNRLAAYEDTGLEPAEIEIANKVIVSAFNLVAKSGTDMLIERLKEIICAEAENRLLVPPCKVGDMVFYIRGQHIIGDTVQRIVLDEISGQVIVDANHCYLFSDVGKNVFRTREEAEEALKEREGT